MKVQNEHTCPSCNQIITEKFCSNCGEKKISPHDFSIKHFIEESIEGFTHFDNKFFRSIRLLFFKPGALTLAFEHGKRVPYMKPMQLFVISNLLFFFFFGGFNLFTVSLDNYLDYNNYTRVGTLKTFNNKFSEHPNPKEIALLFDQKVVTQSKAFIFLFIPFIALGCFLLFFKRKKYFSLHLVFAAHFFTFLLLFFMLFGFLIEAPARLFKMADPKIEIIALSIILPVVVLYLIISIRRFYKVKWLWCILAGVFITYLFSQLLQFYRIGLFYKIIYSL